MAKVELDGAGVLTGVGQIKARGVAQHVWVDRELDTGGLGGCRHDVMRRPPRNRAAAQRREHIRCRVTLFAPPRPQGPKLRAAQWVGQAEPCLSRVTCSRPALRST